MFILLTGLSLLIDGNTFNYTSLTNESVTLNGSVAVSRPENDSFLMVFPSGISVTVKVVSGALSIVFEAPRSFKNVTKGLLGTWNGNPEDDFLTPNGTILPSNASSKDIHNNFGLSCKSSVFAYNFSQPVKYLYSSHTSYLSPVHHARSFVRIITLS